MNISHQLPQTTHETKLRPPGNTSRERYREKIETNSQEAEDCQTKLKPGTKSGETTRNDPTTLEETQEPLNVQNEGRATKQREEDIHLDWAEEVTTHEEDQAEEMEVVDGKPK
jgi:hypothetical protein